MYSTFIKWCHSQPIFCPLFLYLVTLLLVMVYSIYLECHFLNQHVLTMMLNNLEELILLIHILEMTPSIEFNHTIVLIPINRQLNNSFSSMSPPIIVEGPLTVSNIFDSQHN